MLAHNRLAASQLQWSEEMYGFPWRTGSDGDMFGRWPLPVHVATLLARRSSPTALVAGLSADALTNAIRFHLTFRRAEAAAVADAPALAAVCDGFGGEFRVVAHSLGCRLVLEALPLLPPNRRPIEVHLCAAAATESLAAERLSQLCAPGADGRGVCHYYSASDEVLATGFWLASGGVPALGSAPLSRSLPPPPPPAGAIAVPVRSVDATPYFESVLVHGAYKSVLDRLVVDAALGLPPPPPPDPWMRRQQLLLHAALLKTMAKLPTELPGITRLPRLRVPALRLPAVPRIGVPALPTLPSAANTLGAALNRLRRGRRGE